MEIAFRTRKLEKAFNTQRVLKKQYGARMARILMIRLAVLKNARTLAMVPTTPPERLHKLGGKRSGQYAVDLVHPYRLILEPGNEPVPRGQDGSVDLDQVTAITVIDVVDYH